MLQRVVGRDQYLSIGSIAINCNSPLAGLSPLAAMSHPPCPSDSIDELKQLIRPRLQPKSVICRCTAQQTSPFSACFAQAVAQSVSPP